MKYVWIVLLLLIVLVAFRLLRRGSSSSAPSGPTYPDRAVTPPKPAVGAPSAYAAPADELGAPRSIFDPVDPTPVAAPEPVAAAASEGDYQPRRGAGMDDAAEQAAATETPVAEDEPAAPAADDAPAAADEPAPVAADEPAPVAADESGAAAEDSAPAADESTAAVEDAAPAADESATSTEPETATEPEATTEPAVEPDGAPADEASAAEGGVQQASWTTSQWDADHTVAEERGDPEHPHFDDEVSEPANEDASSEVHEGAFDADHAEAPEDTVASPDDAADGADSVEGSSWDEGGGEAEADSAAGDSAAEDTVSDEPAEPAADEPADAAPADEDLAAKDEAAVGAAELADDSPGELAAEAGEGAGESVAAEDSANDAPADTDADADSDPAAKSPEGGWVRRISSLDEVQDGGYGVGSAATFEDDAQPLGHPIQAWEDTKTYVAPGHPAYDTAEPHVWFHDEDAAQRAGFRPVD